MPVVLISDSCAGCDDAGLEVCKARRITAGNCYRGEIKTDNRCLRVDNNEGDICAICGISHIKCYHDAKPTVQKTEITRSGRRWLAKNITKQCDEILSLFLYKNKDYGADEDAFANFRKSAARFGTAKTEKERMIQVLMILQDKHLVGLSHTLGTGKEDKERLLDVAIYSLLARAILDS